MFGLDTVNRDADFFRIAVLLPSDQEESKQRPSTRPFFFFFFSDALLPFCWTRELFPFTNNGATEGYHDSIYVYKQ